MKALRQARGGILFIDEVHGLDKGSSGNFGYSAEAVEALVGHITEKEFKGNLLVIMAGYEAEVDSMFTNANPGLRSRFDKFRVSFPAWTGEQACEAAIAKIVADGKTITEGAQSALKESFHKMSLLKSWASARDVYETILPKMISKRAVRIRLAQGSDKDPSLAYTVEDVNAAFANVLNETNEFSNGQEQVKTVSSGYIQLFPSVSSTGNNDCYLPEAGSINILRPQARKKLRYSKRSTVDDLSQEGTDPGQEEIWASLEKVIHP